MRRDPNLAAAAGVWYKLGRALVSPGTRSPHRRAKPGPFRSTAVAAICVLAAAVMIAVGTTAADLEAQQIPAASESQLPEAARLIQQGDLEQAITLLNGILDVRPSDVEALLLLGTAQSMIPRRTEAVEALLRAIELAPERARVHAAAGAAFARLGEQDAAVQVFERAISLNPELGDAHLNIALILAGKQEFERAAAHMAKALSLETDRGKRARLHFLNGKLHSERDQLEEAAAEFRHSIEVDPKIGAAYLALGLVRKRLLLEDEAFPLFQKAVELAPDDPAAHYQLALELQRRGDSGAAAVHLLKAHALRPDDQSVVYNLTRSLHKAGRRDEARRFRELLAKMIASGDKARENELETARLHGEAVRLEAEGKYAAALDRYRAVLRFEPLNAVARRNLALVLCRLGRWDEGIEELEEILRGNPADAETARALSIVLDQARQRDPPAGRKVGEDP